MCMCADWKSLTMDCQSSGESKEGERVFTRYCFLIPFVAPFFFFVSHMQSLLFSLFLCPNISFLLIRLTQLQSLSLCTCLHFSPDKEKKDQNSVFSFFPAGSLFCHFLVQQAAKRMCEQIGEPVKTFFAGESERQRKSAPSKRMRSFHVLLS